MPLSPRISTDVSSGATRAIICSSLPIDGLSPTMPASPAPSRSSSCAFSAWSRSTCRAVSRAATASVAMALRVSRCSARLPSSRSGKAATIAPATAPRLESATAIMRFAASTTTPSAKTRAASSPRAGVDAELPRGRPQFAGLAPQHHAAPADRHDIGDQPEELALPGSRDAWDSAPRPGRETETGAQQARSSVWFCESQGAAGASSR